MSNFVGPCRYGRAVTHPPLPELRTGRLLLRRLRPEDREPVVDLYDDPEANGWDPMAMGPEEARERFDGWLADWAERGLSYWMADDLATGELAGMGGIRHYTEDGVPGLNLAYRFHRGFWGRGYATELARAAVEWAEEHAPDYPVTVLTTPGHAQSLRVAEKLGFVLVDERNTRGFAEVLLRRQP